MERTLRYETLNISINRILFVLFCVLGIFLISLPAKAQQTSEPKIFVNSTIAEDDTVIGPQFIYLIKQDIQNSGRYLLSLNPNLNEYTFVIDTIVDSKENGTDFSDAYAATLIFHFNDTKLYDMYMTSSVGTCGETVIATCAQTVVASFLNDIDSIRTSSN